MARKNTRGLLLSFHKPTKRWCKVIGGKRRYFGAGNGVSDRTSYHAAVIRYKKLKKEMEENTEAQSEEADNENLSALLNHAVQTVREQLDDQGRRLFAQIFKTTAAMPNISIKVGDTGETRYWARTAGAPVQNDNSADALLDRFLKHQEERFERTRSTPTLSRKERLGGHAFRNSKYSIEAMRSHFRQCGLQELDDPQATEKALDGMRRSLDQLVAEGKLEAGTAFARLKAARPFFKWLWQKRLVQEQPRNLSDVCRRATPVPSAKPLHLDTIHALWDAADSSIRCWMALALNCGYYAIDIATLEHSHLTTKNQHIARLRNKTSIPSKHLLWPVTKKLIAKCRSDDERLLLVRKNGKPLVVEKAGSGNKYDGIATRFRRLTESVGVHATFSQFRDTSAKLIESLAVNGRGVSDKSVVSQFLGHGDPRMARYYLEAGPDQLDTAKLDRILRQLQKKYRLVDE